ncbi:MAG: tetratricopeptide repeat protein [Bacteroidales bacterium]
MSDQENKQVKNEISGKLIEEKLNQAWVLRYKDPKKAFEKALEAYSFSLSTGDKALQMKTRLIKAICVHLNQSGIEKLEIEFITLRDYFEELHDTKHFIIASDYLARLYDNFGWYEKGIEIARKAFHRLQFENYPEIKGELLTTMANLYRRLKDYKNALLYHQNALEIREKSGNKQAIASTLNLLARTYSEIGNLEESYHFYNKALAFRQEINDPAISYTYIGLASNHELENHFSDAEKMYLKCLETNHQYSNDKICFYLGYYGLGNIYFRMKNYEKAFRILELALKYATESGIRINIGKTHLLLSQVYQNIGNFESALKHLKEYMGISEEITTNQINQLKNVELKLKLEELEHRSRNIIESIEYGKRIQSAMLSPAELLEPYFSDHFILFKPRNIVSGDFYWFAPVENKLLICVADCTGHGVPGAFMSVLGISCLNEIVSRDNLLKTHKILAKLNKKIARALQKKGDSTDQPDGIDLSLCIFDFEHKTIRFSGAKNSLFLFRNKELIEYKGDRISIGSLKENEEFASHEIEIRKGDVFYMFSDGYADQAGGPNGRKFMQKNLNDLLLEVHQKPMQQQKEILDITIEKWKSHLNNLNETYDQTDDILVMGIKY